MGGQRHTPAALPPVPIVQEAGWAPGLVWTGAKNLALHRDSIPGPYDTVLTLTIITDTALA
jgi:hypothetical protein